MKHYTQLTREERYQISALKTAGQSKTQIAKVLGRHKSTIGREMARNRGLRGYRPKQADSLAVKRRQEKASCRISHESWVRVEQLIREYWSPEQVSLWLRQEESLHVSPEWIYQYILTSWAVIIGVGTGIEIILLTGKMTERLLGRLAIQLKTVCGLRTSTSNTFFVKI